MPRKTRNEIIAGRYFRWILKRRRNTWCADGRSNKPGLGRHSLGTSDRGEALRRIEELDRVKAVECGLADESVLTTPACSTLKLADGVERYLEHLARPAVAGGASAKSRQRYRAVFDKFLAFANQRGVDNWQQVTSKLVASYLTHLERESYAKRSIYFEGTVIKQLIRWAIAERLLPRTAALALPLRKVSGTTTYCWRPEEVQAMIDYCGQRPELNWLGDVILLLSRTDLRISEAAALRWSDVDFGRNLIRVTNDRTTRAAGSARRQTKNRRDRALPIHPDLHNVLECMPRHRDGRVLHGPRGSVLKPDTVRYILVDDVIEPLAERFSSGANNTGFRSGRLHSFRHYFASQCANRGVPERVVIEWLGHHDSTMIRIYYHLHDRDAQRFMRALGFAGAPGGDGASGAAPVGLEAPLDGQASREAS